MKTAIETVGELGNGYFAVSVDDGYCEWTYKLKLSGDLSIHDVMTSVCMLFECYMPKGEMRRGEVVQ